MPITNIFDRMNRDITKAFAPKSVSDTGTDLGCLLTPNDPAVQPFRIAAIPLDPIRPEESPSSNFTSRWVSKEDLVAADYTVVQRDLLTVEDGTVYVVLQTQADSGRGVRLMLEKAERSKQG